MLFDFICMDLKSCVIPRACASPAARKVWTSAAFMANGAAGQGIAKQLAQLNFMDFLEATGTKLTDQRHLCWGRQLREVQHPNFPALNPSAVSWYA